MLSLKFWKAINNPPLSHPVFQYGTRIEQQIDLSQFDNRYIIRLMKMMLVIGTIRLVIHDPSLIVLLIFMAPILAVFLIITILVLLPLIVFAYGTFLATTISLSISVEKKNNTYDLLCVSPDGPLTINWLISNGVLHRNQLFDWLYAAIRIANIIALVGLLIMVIVFSLMVISMLSGNSIQALPDALRTLIEMMVLFAIFCTGYIQSVVLSVVIGLLIPQYNTDKYVAQPVAIASYIALQLGTYMVAFFLAFSLSTSLSGHYMVLDFFLPILYFIIFFSIRELVIGWLWRHIGYRINADPEDMRYLHALARLG
jgi:hypothetical protein